MYAKVNNNYKLYVQLQNGKILVSCKSNLEIVEECLDKINYKKIKNNVLLSSENNCKLLIDEHTFDNTYSNFTFNQSLEIINYKPNMIVNLQPKHLNDLRILKEEAQSLNNHINLHAVLHITHISVTVIILIILCIAGTILCIVRNKIVFQFKRKDYRRQQGLPSDEIELQSSSTSQNEDVLS